MTMARMKLVLGVVVIAAAAALIFVQYQTQQKLRTENDSLRQQIAALKSDNQDTSATNSTADSSADFNELLRHRG